MSIFKTLGNMFSTKMEVEENFGWHNISTQEEVTDVLAASNEKPQVIYKHSPTCAISYLALKNLEGISGDSKKKAEYHIIDVVGQRSLSNHISEKLAIRHESPQMFIIKEGEVIWNGSHHQVKSSVISELL